MDLPHRDREAIWHPFTQMKNAPPPIPIVRGEGTLLFEASGKAYIDAISSWWVNLHGHAHPVIGKAIADQARELEHVIFAGFTHRPAVELAEQLIGMLPPGFSKVFYSDNGSTAVEVALKMGIQYWHNVGEKKRKKIIAFENAYHGDTFGAMASGARGAFNAPFHDFLFDVHHVPLPVGPDKERVYAMVEGLVKQGDVAAFIFEPLVQGAGGMVMYGAKELDDLMGIVQREGVLCIADEVMTGFGRTGKLFAMEYLKARPDIVCLSKGITGGFMPLGATVCNEKIYKAFLSDDSSRTFFHGHSYTGNPLSCAAGLASAGLLLGEGCRQQIEGIVQRHRDFMGSFQQGVVRDIRQLGTILAVELDTGEGATYFSRARDEAYAMALDNGVLLRPLGNVLYVMPPYCITSGELDRVYEVIATIARQLKLKYCPQG